MIRRQVEVTLLRAGLPWSVFENADQQTILQYYALMQLSDEEMHERLKGLSS